MDIQTLILMLAVSNLIFGLELILFQLREPYSARNPYWIAGKLLQCLGWLLLAGRNDLPTIVVVPFGNGAILCGLAYECWAMLQISGRPVSRTLHGFTATSILLICILFIPLSVSTVQRIIITSALSGGIFALSGWAMLYGPGEKSLLRRYLGWNMWLITVIQCLRIAWSALAPPEGIHLFTGNLVQTLTFGGYFYIVLTNGFGMLLLTREATDRELNRVLAEQKTILETLPTGLCIVRERRIERCNPAMEAMFRFVPGTLAGQSARCLYDSDEAYAEHGRTLYSAIEQNGHFEGEAAVVRQDGQRFWVKALGASLLPQRPRESVVFSVTDITEQIQQQEALAAAKEQAEAANRAKSEFLSNMSHEIRTPLNAILGFAQVLGRDPDLNKTQRDSLITIQRSGEYLLVLINNILDMAKIEAGRMTLHETPFDPTALVTEIEALFQQRSRDRGLVLTIEASGLPRRVVGDGHKLRQVLINLVGNAVKFTTAGSVTLRVEKSVATTSAPPPNPLPRGEGEQTPSPLVREGWGAGEPIRFSVIDTGTGIAPEEMGRLFESFSQTASGRKVHGGTGLGLALSHQFVRLMQGELTAESTLGQGSCFTFTLPLQTVMIEDESTISGREVPVIGLAPGQPVCRILIVDDLADNRAPLRALLNTLNPQPPVLECREAADGQEAVAIWEAWQPHVIFMDMRMPVLSGEEATRQIKARMAARSETVQSLIVALTASAFNENRDYFLASGCDEFARKPFVAEELFTILEQRVGLQFLRAGDAPASTALPLSAEAVATRLAACSEPWQAALKDAVELGDFGRITELVEQIQNRDAALRETLAQWAYHYDLEAFIRLFRPAEEGGH